MNKTKKLYGIMVFIVFLTSTSRKVAGREHTPTVTGRGVCGKS